MACVFIFGAFTELVVARGFGAIARGELNVGQQNAMPIAWPPPVESSPRCFEHG